jgi:imidazoleglycerol phosphate synthase cyclase subunit
MTLAARVIPCLDIKDGRVVKGVRFQGLRDAGDPVECAALYEAQGGDEIVLLDVSATPEGRGHALGTVREVRAVLSIPLTVGGGVRGADDAGRLLEAGADKVGVNTAAVSRPPLIGEIAERFGTQCTVLAVDAATTGSGWEVVVESGRARTGIDVLEWCRKATAMGAGEILLTSWDRDGTRQGYDIDLLAAVTDAVTVPVIASGGADQPGHLIEAIDAGASAALIASILHDGDTTVGALKTALAEAGIVVRP